MLVQYYSCADAQLILLKKLKKKTHINYELGLIFFYQYIVHFRIVTSHKLFFSCVSTSCLPCFQKSFLQMKLVKTLLYVQLKQTNLEN